MNTADVAEEQTPTPRYRFRWYIILLPLVPLAAFLILPQLAVTTTWDQLLDTWEVQDRQRFSQTVVLAAICVVILAGARILYGSRFAAGKEVQQ